MKQSDIDRLREKLGDEYELIAQSPDENDKFFVVIAKKKDPWEGVEFAECVIWPKGGGLSFEVGKIYPMNQIKLFGNGSIDLYNPKHEMYSFKPSTESEYVSQLKAQVKELYGEIKDGDEFDRTNMPFKIQQGKNRIFGNTNPILFNYDKETDQLYFNNICLYMHGQWAKKVERVRVEWVDWHWNWIISGKGEDIFYQFKLKNIDWDKVENKDDIGDYLAKCLEEKLNEK